MLTLLLALSLLQEPAWQDEEVKWSDLPALTPEVPHEFELSQCRPGLEPEGDALRWRYDLRSSGRLYVYALADEVDLLLRIRDRNGALLKEDDDSGDREKARQRLAAVTTELRSRRARDTWGLQVQDAIKQIQPLARRLADAPSW